MSDFISSGECGAGINAQNPMLGEYSKKFDLEAADWRNKKPWYEPEKKS